MKNNIHPSTIIEGDVQLGSGNDIGPYCVLRGPLKIGDNNLIGPHVVIGSPGADTREPRADSSHKFIRIGSNNIIREFSAIQKPCYQEITEIMSGIYIMQGANISHDVIIHDQAVLAANSAIAGLCRLLPGAYIGMGATVNQRLVIGAYSIVAAGAPVTKNVRPFSRYIPGKPVSVNHYAISKFGFEPHASEISDYVLHAKPTLAESVSSLIYDFETLAKFANCAAY